MVHKLPYLSRLSIVVQRDTSLPTPSLPNLTGLGLECDHGRDWLQGFRGATFGRLASATPLPEYESIGDLLEAFWTVALTTSMMAFRELSANTLVMSEPCTTLSAPLVLLGEFPN